MREEEEKQQKAEDAALRRAEAKARAMELTSENLKLKKRLEEQRMQDARESREFQKRILAEEKERQRILDQIEERRKNLERERKEVQERLAANKNLSDKDINELLAANRERLAYARNAGQAERDAEYKAEKEGLEMEHSPTRMGREEARIVNTAAPASQAPASGDSETHVVSRVPHTPMTHTAIS